MNLDRPHVDECLDSPSGRDDFFNGSNSTATVHYYAKHYKTYEAAREAVIVKAATKFGTLSIKTVSVHPISGTDCWDATVEYAYDKSNVDVVLGYRFSTTGGTSHITQSRQTMRCLSAINGLPPIDCGGAIGVDERGDVEGCDIKSPAFTFSTTQAFSVNFMTQARRRFLMRMSGRINSASFWGFLPGEVLFEGVSDGELVSKSDDTTGGISWYYKLTFTFSVKENQFNIQIGDLWLDKAGWDYLWVLYQTRTDGQTQTKFPRNVYVERVYPEADFNEFGLIEL